MPSVKDLSVAALEKMLTRKRSQLDRLTRRRSTLQRQLATVDRQIVQLGGSNGSPVSVRRKVRRRPTNAKPLYEVVVDVLKKSKGGLSMDELANKVQATGYKTHSSDFKNVVYQCLYNNGKTFVRDENAGVYKLR
jgi:hypothetical protein